MDVAGKIWILPASGGNFKNFILKKFSGRIAYCTILTINTLLNKSLNLPPLVGKIRILPATSTFVYREIFNPRITDHEEGNPRIGRIGRIGHCIQHQLISRIMTQIFKISIVRLK